MIVITNKRVHPIHVQPGDTFNLTVSDSKFHKEIISEKITETKTLDFIASFRFADTDGTCIGMNLCGIFCESSKLPVEIRIAIMYEDLNPEQRNNFLKSCGTKL